LTNDLQKCSDGNVGKFLKFRFLKTVEEAPLALSYSISTEQQAKLHFKHKKMYLTENNVVFE
jgi:hypothetical protein